jgi:hypothetical protein
MSSSAPPAAARGNPERDPTPPRRPSPGRGGSGGGGGGGGDPGGSGGGGGPGKPPKPSTPRPSGDKPKLPKKKPGDDDRDDDDDDDSSSPSDPDVADEGDAVNKLLAKVLKSKKTRTKEAETIKLSNVPEAAVKFKAWWSETRNLVAAASGRGDRGLQWFMKIEADDMTFEKLAKTGKNWRRFDAVLHAAIVKSVQLARDIALQGEIAAKEGRLLRGRQSAFMVRK